jgi:hypothetical protein
MPEYKAKIATEYKIRLNPKIMHDVVGTTLLKTPDTDVILIRCQTATKNVYKELKEFSSNLRNSLGRPVRVEIAETVKPSA